MSSGAPYRPKELLFDGLVRAIALPPVAPVQATARSRPRWQSESTARAGLQNAASRSGNPAVTPGVAANCAQGRRRAAVAQSTTEEILRVQRRSPRPVRGGHGHTMVGTRPAPCSRGARLGKGKGASMRTLWSTPVGRTVLVSVLAATVAYGADQTILGPTFLTKNPRPATRRKVLVKAKEPASPCIHGTGGDSARVSRRKESQGRDARAPASRAMA